MNILTDRSKREGWQLLGLSQQQPLLNSTVKISDLFFGKDGNNFINHWSNDDWCFVLAGILKTTHKKVAFHKFASNSPIEHKSKLTAFVSGESIALKNLYRHINTELDHLRFITAFTAELLSGSLKIKNSSLLKEMLFIELMDRVLLIDDFDKDLVLVPQSDVVAWTVDQFIFNGFSKFVKDFNDSIAWGKVFDTWMRNNRGVTTPILTVTGQANIIDMRNVSFI